MSDIVRELDTVAAALETAGYRKLASEVDVVSNTIEAGRIQQETSFPGTNDPAGVDRLLDHGQPAGPLSKGFGVTVPGAGVAEMQEVMQLVAKLNDLAQRMTEAGTDLDKLITLRREWHVLSEDLRRAEKKAKLA